MPATTVNSGPAIVSSPRGNRWRGVALAGALLALTLWFFTPVKRVVDPTLDNSNYASFAYFTAHGFQFGKDVLHVGGPYGFVHYGFVHGGNLYWKRLPLEFLTKLVFSALVLWFFGRAPAGFVRWAWLGLVMFLVPLVEDLPYDLSILLGGLCLLTCHTSAARRDHLISAGVSVFLAFLTLMKGTHAVLAVATFALLGFQAWRLREWRRLIVAVATYLAAVVSLLILAGQNPLNFPAYFLSIIEQSSGYNAAMALDEPAGTFVAGVGALLGLEALIALTLLKNRHDPLHFAGSLLLAGFTFVEWKHGFVRADGHVYIFFQYACIAAPTILLFSAQRAAAPGNGFRIARWVTAGSALALGIWGDGWQSLGRYAWMARELPPTLAQSARQLMFPSRSKARFDAALDAQRETFDLPRTRELVKDAPIDFFGVAHSYLTLNRLNYRPRPMGGGNFSVFNAWLQDANLRMVANPATAPQFFLSRIEMFDNRFLAQDDAGTLRAILALYHPVDAERGMVLFQRNPGTPVLPDPIFLGTEPLAFGQPVSLPTVTHGEMVAVEFDLPLNIPGRLRSVAYKAPLLFLDVTGDGIEFPNYRRLVAGEFQRPVILNPVIEHTDDLVALYGEGAEKVSRSFTVHTEHPGLFDTSKLSARFYALPQPAFTADASEINRKLAFPAANRPPLAMQPANAPLRIFDGLLVQMLEPPGRIRFALSGRENRIDFRFGIDPEAYTKGKTDGVEFIAELERPGQPPQTLFGRLLRPRREAPDRGEQTAHLILPPFPPGSTLSLRTEPGPDHDGAWDWGYFTGIRILGEGFIPEQFPRFSVVPTQVEAAMAGILPSEGRDLFMLNSPGTLRFRLNGGERRLQFSVGLLAGAYTGAGESDGIELIVALRQSDGAETPIFERHIDPRTRPEDRGDCHFSVALPPAMTSSELVFRVGPGPHRNNAWDWAYIESMNLE